MQYLLIAVFLFFACCINAQAEGAIIGPLCIDGVTSTQHPNRATIQGDGVWTPTDFKIDSMLASSAKLTVFDRTIPPSNKLESCNDILKRMNAIGALPIVSGRLRTLDMEAQIFTSSAGNRVQINSGNFAATLAEVDSGVRPVAGGTIDLRKSRLWIKLTDTLLSSSSGIQGEFEIEAWNRSIVDAHIGLGQHLTFVTTLQARDESNVAIRVNLTDGIARLWKGDLVSKLPIQSQGDVELPVITMKAARLQAAGVEVKATDGSISASLSEVTGTASEYAVPGPDLNWKMANSSMVTKRLDGNVNQRPTDLTIERAILRELSIDIGDTSLQTRSGADLYQGRSKVYFELLSEIERKVTSEWTNVRSPALSAILPKGFSKLTWQENGANSDLRFSGHGEFSDLKLGGLSLEQPLSLAFLPTRSNSDLFIPIKIDVPSASGKVSFSHDGHDIAVEGRLEKLAIDGKLVIPLNDLTRSSLQVPRDKLLLTVGAAVSVSPFIAGTKPNFFDAKLMVFNDTDVVIGLSKSSGSTLISTSVLLLAQPVLKIGDNGSESAATLDLKSDGVAKIRFDLDTGKTALVFANLSVSEVAFSLLGSQPRIVELGGNLIEDPTLSLKRLTVQIDQLGPIKIEQAHLDKLTIQAASVTKLRPTGTDEGLTYRGKLSRPLTLDSAHALHVRIGDKIVLGGFEINLFDLAIENATANLGGGMALRDTSLILKTKQIQEAQILNRPVGQVSGAQLLIDGKLELKSPSISLNNAVAAKIKVELDGPENALNGIGELQFGGFTGNARSELVIKFDCRDTGELRVPVESNLGVGGGMFELRLDQGQVSAQGTTGPFDASIHSLNRDTGCDNPVTKHVVQKQGEWWTDGICSRGFEIYHCRWESPEVSYSYHIHLSVRSLSANFLLSDPHVFLDHKGQISVCNRGALLLTPGLIAGGYSPGIDSPYPGLDNIVNGLIQGAFEPVESIILTGLGQGIGWLVSSTATTVGNLMCIGKPL